jgi:hypothetical protein
VSCRTVGFRGLVGEAGSRLKTRITDTRQTAFEPIVGRGCRLAPERARACGLRRKETRQRLFSWGPLSDSNRRPPLYKNETGPSDA